MAIANKLTQKQILNTEGPAVLNDGNGLYIRVRSTGHASWFCRIRHPQTKKLIDKVFGHFPEMSLSQARRNLNKVKDTLITSCINDNLNKKRSVFETMPKAISIEKRPNGVIRNTGNNGGTRYEIMPIQ